MPLTDSPYAAALDGLDLADPVAAFFDFCRAREAVRVARRSGAPPPWTDDPILQRGRFLNVFREDDRGSQAIARFVAPVVDDVPALIHALLFARWCNRQETLDALSVHELDDPERLRDRLLVWPDPPWCNVAAYPVEPIRWQGVLTSRLDTATRWLHAHRDALTQAILGADGDVVAATARVNALLGMDNDFAVFMAVVDVGGLRPDVIDLDRPVPTGIGAAPYLDRLQAHLGLDSHAATCDRMIALQPTHWPDAKRALQPIDVEYLSCECRKYYSYVNGTKSFTGKNAFEPGRSACLGWDIVRPPSERIQTRIHVLAGGPCSGKSTLLHALAARGHRVVPETSQGLIQAGLARGQTAAELRADPEAWQRAILTADHALFDALPTDQVVFTDTSFIENLIYAARAGIAVGPNALEWLRRKRYAQVFFLDPVARYEQTDVRMESPALARHLSDQVRARYQHHGYALTRVPAVSVDRRIAQIEATLG